MQLDAYFTLPPALAATIMGGAVSDVTVTVPGVQSTVVSGYDDLTVTLEQRGSDGKALGHTVLGQGSPAVTGATTEAIVAADPPSGTANQVTRPPASTEMPVPLAVALSRRRP